MVTVLKIGAVTDELAEVVETVMVVDGEDTEARAKPSTDAWLIDELVDVVVLVVLAVDPNAKLKGVAAGNTGLDEEVKEEVLDDVETGIVGATAVDDVESVLVFVVASVDGFDGITVKADWEDGTKL